jgi:hypothetical protein
MRKREEQDEQDMQDIGIRKQDKAIFIEKFHDFYFNYPAYPAHPVLFMIWRELLKRYR